MQCPACNATMANDATQCPQCGTQVAPGGRRSGQPPRDDRPKQQRQPQQSGQPQHGGAAGQPRRGRQPAQGADQDQGTSGARGGYRKPRAGPSLSTQARDLFSELPWRGGIIAGVVVYGFGYVSLAVLTTGLGADMDGLAVAAELFFGIVSFVSASDLVVQVFNPGPDTSRELLSGRYDGMLGLFYLIVPALLYLTGRKFAEWNATEGDGVDLYLATGATVVLGTLPVSIALAVLAGTNVVSHVLIGGLFVPGLAGVFGATMAWVFQDNARTASYGAGVFTGLLGYALVFVSILATATQLLAATSGGLLLVALAAVFVVVNVTAFAIGAGGVVGFLLVALPVVGLGYLRASRGPDEVGDALDGARAGASLVAGFASFVFVPLAIYAILSSPAGAGVASGNVGMAFGPQASGITLITSPGALLQTFLIAGVVFPVVFGGIGGAIAGHLAAGASRGQAGQGHQPGPGGRLQQPRQGAGHAQPRQPQGNAPDQGRGQAPQQSPPPAQQGDQSVPQAEPQPPADESEAGGSQGGQRKGD